MPDTITLPLSPGVTLVLDHAVAVTALERLTAALDDQGLTDPLVLDDGHPARVRASIRLPSSSPARSAATAPAARRPSKNDDRLVPRPATTHASRTLVRS